MVDALKYLQSKWLRSEDIEDDQPVDVTIAAVKPAKYKDDDDNEHLDVYFEEYPKSPLGLNNKNLKKLVEFFGRDTSEWIGERVTLVVRMVEVGGEEKKGIRFADELPRRARQAKRRSDDVEDTPTRRKRPAKKSRRFEHE